MDWFVPPAELELSPHSVDVWRTPLELPAAQIEACFDVLSDEERQRARRFRHEEKRHEYIIVRGLLRRLLGRLLACRPDGLVFSYESHGKPFLPAAGGAPVEFNVSHTRGMALLAFSLERRVGVDIEWMRPQVQCESPATRYFSPAEVQVFLRLPEDQRRLAFFHCWTRKEALLKAVGQGITLGLDQFDVTLEPGRPAELLATRYNPADVDRWTLENLSAGGDYTAALACELPPGGQRPEVRCWLAWPGS